MTLDTNYLRDTMNAKEDVNLIVDLRGCRGRRTRDRPLGNIVMMVLWPRRMLQHHGTTTNDGFVDIVVAPFAEELAVGEAIGGSIEVTVQKLLDLDVVAFLFGR